MRQSSFKKLKSKRSNPSTQRGRRKLPMSSQHQATTTIQGLLTLDVEKDLMPAIKPALLGDVRERLRVLMSGVETQARNTFICHECPLKQTEGKDVFADSVGSATPVSQTPIHVTAKAAFFAPTALSKIQSHVPVCNRRHESFSDHIEWLDCVTGFGGQQGRMSWKLALKLVYYIK